MEHQRDQRVPPTRNWLAPGRYACFRSKEVKTWRNAIARRWGAVGGGRCLRKVGIASSGVHLILPCKHWSTLQASAYVIFLLLYSSLETISLETIASQLAYQSTTSLGLAQLHLRSSKVVVATGAAARGSKKCYNFLQK